jgi:hypothetical protein
MRLISWTLRSGSEHILQEVICEMFNIILLADRPYRMDDRLDTESR